jgi:hypothetical protein
MSKTDEDIASVCQELAGNLMALSLEIYLSADDDGVLYASCQDGRRVEGIENVVRLLEQMAATLRGKQ